MNPSEYAQWYYLIYLLPGGIALLILLLSAMGGGRHHRIGTGHGHHVSSHGTGHVRVGHHSSHSTGHPAPTAHKSAPTQGRIGGNANLGQQVMSFFGLGRVPTPFLWGSGMLGWGLFGFWGTQFWQERLHHPALFLLPALGVALVGALVTEKVTAEIGARVLPKDETYATSTVELCGQIGTVAFPVDATRGRVHVYDAYGTMHDVMARVAAGQAGIGRGHKVLVTDYDAARDYLIVEEIA